MKEKEENSWKQKNKSERQEKIVTPMTGNRRGGNFFAVKNVEQNIKRRGQKSEQATAFTIKKL